ncbi:nucleotidyltransferase family protein (plasmid) [Agrobacterium sp. rho-8.1]|nr:nucleotidyltransferase family protein [Agrobacterium sp. rho-8.1]
MTKTTSFNITDRPRPSYKPSEVSFIRQFVCDYAQGGAAAMPRAIKPKTDWEELRALLIDFRIFTPFYSIYEQYIPTDMREIFQETHANIIGRLGVALEIAQSISQEAKTRNINHAFVKGAALAQVIHGDPTLRDSGDVDILIEQIKVPEMHFLLRKAGFRQILNDFFSDSSNIPNEDVPVPIYKTTPRLLSDFVKMVDGIKVKIEVHVEFRGISTDHQFRLFVYSSDQLCNGKIRRCLSEKHSLILFLVDKYKDMTKGRALWVRDILDINRAVHKFNTEKFWRTLIAEAEVLGCDRQILAALASATKIIGIRPHHIEFIFEYELPEVDQFDYLDLEVMMSGHHSLISARHANWRASMLWKAAAQGKSPSYTLQSPPIGLGMRYVIPTLFGVAFEAEIIADQNSMIWRFSAPKVELDFLGNFSLQTKFIEDDPTVPFPGSGYELFVREGIGIIRALGGKSEGETNEDVAVNIKQSEDEGRVTFELFVPFQRINMSSAPQGKRFGFEHYVRREVYRFHSVTGYIPTFAGDTEPAEVVIVD